uniref:Uncharacterized protein n=1 Tax=Capra hircus TaxID=9925 RepID=A0A8C2QVE5_CAPHI
MTLPTALVAPVEAGMMFWAAPRPSCHSFPEGPSTVFWVAVMRRRGHTSLHDAKVVMDDLGQGGLAVGGAGGIADNLEGVVILLVFHAHHKHGASEEGTERMTLLVPHFKGAPAFSMVVKTPEDSTTYSAPASPYLMMVGFCSWKMVMAFPSMMSFLFSALTVSWNLPWVESY